jgi:hypothetical protein
MKALTNTNSQTTALNWTGIYKLGGVSALILVAIIIIQGIVASLAPQPLEGTALDWFKLFEKNALIGLIDFELLMVVYVILSIPIALALYVLLRPVSPSWTAVYLVLGLLGTICFITARPALEMLSVSQSYAAATTEAEKAMYLAAGQSMVAIFHGTAFQIGYLLGSLTGLIISLVMLKTNIFSKTTAYVRIGSAICDFGLFIPAVGLYISLFSVLFLLIWDILIAHRLFQLAKSNS